MTKLCICSLQQEKLQQTRKFYATYNALVEIKELMLKETSLLNSINSQVGMFWLLLLILLIFLIIFLILHVNFYSFKMLLLALLVAWSLLIPWKELLRELNR